VSDRSPEPPDPGLRAYRDSGVDLEAAAEAVAMIRDLAGASPGPEVVAGVGGFAGLIDLGDGRLLAAATDGVGTKLEVARLVAKLDTVGIDLVAMSANDVVCTGARPLFFLDYLAVERVVPEEVAAIVSGVAEGCRRAGCALLGGETAEHPDVMPRGGFDLAGFCVGIVDRDALLDPADVTPGDSLVGLRSTGIHANGFSLVRGAVLEKGGRSLTEFVPSLGRTLGEELLEPTALYVDALLALADRGLARSAAHITGGGFPENVPRALPQGLGARIDTSAWDPQPVFGLVAEAAGVPLWELAGVLNMGIGMVVVAPAGRGEEAIAVAAESGADAVEIGSVDDSAGIALR
jgi:phosphoribosylformylglycinamidine cyclo-ligase